MAFDKEEYWKNRNNKVELKDEKNNPVLDDDGKPVMVSKPLRGQGKKHSTSGTLQPSGGVELTFDHNGKLVSNNRKQRRRRVKSNLFTRKGFYDRLGAIKITRRKGNKIKHKYVIVDRNGV